MLLRDELQILRDRLRGRSLRGWRWALHDVSFEAAPGDAIGLIGANGSGKSTLLKILTRVMYPYAGHAEVGGRIGALIEVVHGIHPDLTGRENVAIYGSLLGLSRRQVATRFDAIVEFAELENAIDRQVKFYSSGMQMRLGFGVAAFLEPAVLLLDEVLAVGDASFQERCLERVRTVLAQGTTLMFVSHDLDSVERICRRGIWLRDGVVEADGAVGEVTDLYRQWLAHRSDGDGGGARVRVAGADVVASNGSGMQSGAPCEIKLVIESQDALAGRLFLGVSEGSALPILLLQRDLQLHGGKTETRWPLQTLPLPRGRFYVWVGLFDKSGRDVLTWHPAAHFDVDGRDPTAPVDTLVESVREQLADWEVVRR